MARPVTDERNQGMGLIRKPLLVSKKEVEDDHRGANYMITEISSKYAELR
jgi:hypothetical protein